MPRRVGVLSALFLITLASCSTIQIGRDFDVRVFESKVQRGMTTQAQVRGWLGAPNSTGIAVDTNGERFDEWIYYYGVGQLPNSADARLKMLQIKFNQKGFVQGYNWSDERK